MANNGDGATRSTSGESEGVDHGQRGLNAAPGRLIRTIEGHITAWSPDMQRRYGFTSEEAQGRTSHQLLRTIFPQALPAIQATLRERNRWSGGLIHRHADGRAVMAVNHWYVYRDIDREACLVTEVHSDIALEGNGACQQLADVLAALAQELSEPLAAINDSVDGAQLFLQRGWPDLPRVREAMAQAFGQIARGVAAVNLLRELANCMHDTG